MTAILSLLGTAIPYGGVAIAALLVAAGSLWGYETVHYNVAVSSRDSQITALHSQIDDPNSGYVVQIGRANAATAQVRANLGTCQAAVTDSNAKLDALAAQGVAKQAAAAKAQADLAASQGAAKQLVAQIASFKPTADACVDAGTILRTVGR